MIYVMRWIYSLNLINIIRLMYWSIWQTWSHTTASNEATLTACERIEAKPVDGRAVDWAEKLTVISASRSGDVETGTREIGEIRAILMPGCHQAVADTLCIDDTLATVIDSKFPRVSNFDDLPELSDRDVKLSLGNLEARKHPRGGH